MEHSVALFLLNRKCLALGLQGPLADVTPWASLALEDRVSPGMLQGKQKPHRRKFKSSEEMTKQR